MKRDSYSGPAMTSLRRTKRSSGSLSATNRLKLWFVRRWLHLLSDDEVYTENMRRTMDKQFAAIYTKMVDGMMEYFPIPAEDMYLKLDADDLQGNFEFTGEHKTEAKASPERGR